MKMPDADRVTSSAQGNLFRRAGVCRAALKQKPLALIRGPQGTLLTVAAITPDQSHIPVPPWLLQSRPSILFSLALGSFGWPCEPLWHEPELAFVFDRISPK